MCISSIPRFRRINCTTLVSSFVDHTLAWHEVYGAGGNCSANDSVIYELIEIDAMNNVHKLQINTTNDYLDSLDPGNYNFPNTIWNVKPASEIILKTSLVVPVVIGGVTLNMIILMTLLKNKGLWTPSNYLVANLALIDLLTLMTCPWMMLVHDFYQAYMLGNAGCRLEGFSQASMLLASVGAVMLVSYDRLAAAALPTEARVTKKAAPKLVVLTWIAAIGLSLPLLIYREYRERQWKNYLEIYCMENIQVLPVYWHVIIVALVWVPLSVMVITYGTIIYRLETCAKELCSRGGGVCVVRARGRAMRVTACVLLVAIVCRLPFTWLVYWRNENLMNTQINAVVGTFQMLWFAAHYLIYLNCALNPLIYGFTNERFRRAMDRTPGIAWCKFGSWCCVCWKIPSPTIDKNSEKIFIVTASPQQERKITQMLKNILHVNTYRHDFTLPKTEKTEIKSSKVTPLNADI